jgi:sortase A
MGRGDRVIVAMPYGRFTYVVTGSRVVAPSQVAVLARAAGAERLVLTACHPLFSAAQRLVVTARLQRATPRGIARGATT